MNKNKGIWQDSACQLCKVTVSLRFAHSTASFWCATSASWAPAALHRFLWVPRNSPFLSIAWDAWVCVCSLLFSAVHDFLPHSELMPAVPLPQGVSVEILAGKEQSSPFLSCPAVRTRKRGSSFYCPSTPSLRCIPRKTVLYSSKTETSCHKIEKLAHFLFFWNSMLSIEPSLVSPPPSFSFWPMYPTLNIQIMSR